jgi:hypothetical protein
MGTPFTFFHGRGTSASCIHAAIFPCARTCSRSKSVPRLEHAPDHARNRRQASLPHYRNAHRGTGGPRPGREQVGWEREHPPGFALKQALPRPAQPLPHAPRAPRASSRRRRSSDPHQNRFQAVRSDPRTITRPVLQADSAAGVS